MGRLIGGVRTELPAAGSWGSGGKVTSRCRQVGPSFKRFFIKNEHFGQI